MSRTLRCCVRVCVCCASGILLFDIMVLCMYMYMLLCVCLGAHCVFIHTFFPLTSIIYIYRTRCLEQHISPTFFVCVCVCRVCRMLSHLLTTLHWSFCIAIDQKNLRTSCFDSRENNSHTQTHLHLRPLALLQLARLHTMHRLSGSLESLNDLRTCNTRDLLNRN